MSLITFILGKSQTLPGISSVLLRFPQVRKVSFVFLRRLSLDILSGVRLIYFSGLSMRQLLLPFLSLLRVMSVQFGNELPLNCSNSTEDNSPEKVGRGPRFARIRNPLLWAMVLMLGGLVFGVMRLVAQNSAPPKIAISRHAISVNSGGRIEGSAQMLSGDSINLNSDAYIGGDLLVPGTPSVNANGQINWSGQSSGGGSTSPSNYSINLNSGATLRYLVKQSDPIALETVATPPNPTGTRTLNISNASQATPSAIGSWATVRNLNLNSGAPSLAVPPGTYGTFSVNSGSGLVLGVAGSSAVSTYNLQSLNFNSTTKIVCVSPVTLVIKNGFNINSNATILGSSNNQNWLTVRISDGGLTLNSNSIIYGEVRAPSGAVLVNSSSKIYGTVQANSISINSNGAIKQGTIVAPTPTPTPTPAPTATPTPTPVPNRVPVAVNDSYTTAEDTPLSVQSDKSVLVNDSDPDGDALSVTVKTNVTHGTLNLATNGTFTYTPNADYNGADAFVYTLNDGKGHVATATATITVTPVNDAPVAQNGNATTPEDTAKSLTLVALDADGDALTYAIVKAPTHGTLSTLNGNKVTYTPARDYNGADSFTFKANDATLSSNVATVAIAVTPVNDAPTAADDNNIIDEDTTLTVDAPGVLLNDFDVDGDALSAVKVSDPQHGALTFNSNGSFTYVPNANYNGVDSFTYRASDGQLQSAVATVNLTVSPLNDAPTVSPGSATTPEDTPIVLTVVGSDGDGNALSFFAATQPQHGTLSDFDGNKVTYTPAPNYNGADSFTFKANDGKVDSSAATFALTVTPVNDAPVAANDAYTTREDVPLSIAAPGVLGNDTDIEGDALTASLVTAAAHGTVVLEADGSFTYTPQANYDGPDQFTYSASDGAATANARVTLTVTPSNDKPVAVDSQATIPEDTPKPLVLEATDGDEDALTYSIVDEPEHGTLSAMMGSGVIYTPAANYNGTDSFTWKANDGEADSNVATVSLTITPVDDAPQAFSATYQLNEDAPFPLELRATDGDGDALTYAIVDNSTHGALSASGGQGGPARSYRPIANYFGTDQFTFRVTDSTGKVSNTATIRLIVRPLNDAPIARADAFNTNEDESLAISASGVMKNDEDPEGDTLTAEVIDTTTHGVLELATNGSFTYLPQAGYNGPDRFTYRVQDDNGGEASTVVSIIVVPVNDAPTAVDDAVSSAGTALDIAVLSNDTDPEEDELTVESVSQGNFGGTVTIGVDQKTVRYTPAPGFGSVETFTYRASDGDKSDEATVTVTMTEPAPINSRGNEYWLTIPQNTIREFSDSHRPTLVIAAEEATSVSVTMPLSGNGFSEQFTLAAGQNRDIVLPHNSMLLMRDQVENWGIYVTATKPVTAYVINFQTYQTDGYLGIPTSSLGTHYQAIGYVGLLGYGYRGNIAVVAPENETQVTITGASGQPTQITLSQGQTYQYASDDISGFRIDSNKPVAAFSGSDCSNVPEYVGACNQLLEQLIPVSSWGKEFVTLPLASRQNGDTFRIFASEDGTTFTINGAVQPTLNAGKFQETVLTAASHIESNKPVSVVQYSNGSQYDNTAGDPFMMQVPAVTHYANRYNLTTPASGIASNFVNITIATAELNQLRVDGEDISVSSIAIGNSGYSGISFPVSIGSHSFTTTNGAEFGIALYGFDTFDGYGYPGALGKIPDVVPVDPNPNPTPTPGPDNTAPTVAITQPADGAFVGSLSWIAGTARDNQGGRGIASVTLTLQRQSDGLFWTGDAWGDETWLSSERAGASWWRWNQLPKENDLTEGAYVIKAMAADRAEPANVSAPASITVRVDRDSPSISFVKPLGGTQITELSQVFGSATDVGSGVSSVWWFLQNRNDQFWNGTEWVAEPFMLKARLEDGVWTNESSLPSGASLPLGPYGLTAVAVDGSGKYAQAAIAVNVVEPRPGPTPTPTASPTPTFTATPTPLPTAPPMPDAWIRAGVAGESGFVGDGIYTDDGFGQSRDATTWAPNAAVFVVRVQNDSATPQKLIFTGPSASVNNWTVHYFDAATEGEEITSQASNGGWRTPVLAQGEYVDVRVEAVPSAALSGGSVVTLKLRAFAADGSTFDQVNARIANSFFPEPTPTSGPTPTPGPTPGATPGASPTPNATPSVTPGPTPTPAPKLDAYISTNDASAGQQIWNADATGQTLDQSVEGGEPAVYVAAFVNTSDVARSVTITAPGLASNANWDVRIYTARRDGMFVFPNQDVTADVVGAGYTAFMGADNSANPLVLLIGVEPATTVATNASYDVLLLAKTNNGERDAVKAHTIKKEAVQPTPTPGATPDPNATPGPTPDPNATPNPNPTPGVTPDPNPTPGATPGVTPGPQPTATPNLPPLGPPRIVPHGGTFGGSVEVAIEHDKSNATIFYTLDGSTPTLGAEKTKTYKGKFLLTNSLKVRARAIATGNSASGEDSADFIVNSGQGGAAGATLLSLNYDLEGGQTKTVDLRSGENNSGSAPEITAPSRVKGSISATSTLENWALEYRLEEPDAEWQLLKTGTDKGANIDLGTLDPTLLPNGLYELRLRAFVVINGSRQFAQDTASFIVKGGMKIGHFTLSFNDITLPVAGLPISIVRTYDTRDALAGRKGDFGPGWTLSTNNVRLQKNGKVGVGRDDERVWQTKRGGGFGGFTLAAYPIKPRIVTVTLPDGQVLSFSARLNPQSAATYGGIQERELEWVAQKGTRAKLKSVDESTVSFSESYRDAAGRVVLIYPIGGGGGDDDDPFGDDGGGFDDSNPFDSREFELEMPSGVTMRLSEGQGREALQWIKDLNGNVTRFGKAGIRTYAPDGTELRAALFTRLDPDGPITAISDARNRSVRYDYDGAGDLVGVTNRVDETTNFGYDARHFLETITDARRVKVMAATYAANRLETVADAKGRATRTIHDVNGRVETNFDRKGRQMVTGYDAYGNVTSITRFLNGRPITVNTEYSDPNNPEAPTKITDAMNRVTAATYNSVGSRLTITDNLGHTTTTSYDVSGTRPVVVQDARGVTIVTNGYDSKGNILFFQNALGHRTTFTHWPSGAIKTTTNALSQTSSTVFDSKGNLTQTKDAVGHAVSWNYDGNGNRTQVRTTRTKSDGATENIETNLIYDGENRLTRALNPDDSSTKTVYNLIGKVASQTDELGRTMTYNYDVLGQRTATNAPDGSGLQVAYDDGGLQESITDSAGRVRLYQYDDLDRKTATLNSDNTSSGMTFNDGDELVSLIDKRGATTMISQYDGAGRPTKVQDLFANTVLRHYDDAGRQTGFTDARGFVTQIQYDDAGRTTKQIQPDSTYSQSVFDVLGRTTAARDGAGNWRYFEYDILGRLAKVTIPVDGDAGNNLITTFGYNELGQKMWQKDANGRVTRFAYDMRGRMTARQMPGGQTERMSYDVAGQIRTHTDFRGYTTNYNYDIRGRALSKTPDSRLNEIGVTFEYPDELTTIVRRGTHWSKVVKSPTRNWVDRVESSEGEIRYEHDAVGNLIARKIYRSGQLQWMTGYGYDALNRLARVILPATGGGVQTIDYAYDQNNNRTRVVRSNGIETRYGYDKLNRLSDVAQIKDSVELARYAITMRGDHKRTRVMETLRKPDGAIVSRELLYNYDGAGRLRLETGQDGAGNNYRRAFELDAVGNRLRQTAQDGLATQATNYSYNSNDWLLGTTTQTTGTATGATTSTTSYGYDANGARTSATTGASRVSYAWNFEGHLAQLSSGTRQTRMLYDGSGQRFGREVRVDGALDKAASREMLIDGGGALSQILDERDGNGVEVARYDVADGLTPVREQLRGSDGAVQTRYPLVDGFGSVRQRSDETGQLTDTMFSDSFGLGLSGSAGTTEGTRYGWVGSYSESGLYDLRARFYDAGAGTFLGQDPLMGSNSNPITQHRFLYAGADPVNYVDPSGKNFDLGSLGVTQAISRGIQAYAGYRIISFPAQLTIDQMSLSDTALRAEGYSFPNVAEPMRNVLKEVSDTYSGLSQMQKVRAGAALVGLESLGSWDINELNNYKDPLTPSFAGGDAWIADAVNSYSGNQGSKPLTLEDAEMRFVEVDGQTFHSFSANYAHFGQAMRLAGFEADDVAFYTLGAKFLRPSPNIGLGSTGKDVTAALAWAMAGHNSWSTGGDETPYSIIDSGMPIPVSVWKNSPANLVPSMPDIFNFKWSGVKG